MRPTELSAAAGIPQIKRFAETVAGYRRNALLFKSTIGAIPGIKIQKEIGKSSWMGFYILVEGMFNHEFAHLREVLKWENIEIRPIMCCFHKQPMKRFADYETIGSLDNAEQVYGRGFYVGNTSGDISDQILNLENCLRKAKGKR